MAATDPRFYLVSGSRRAPRGEVWDILARILTPRRQQDRLFHGAASGADTHAADWAQVHGIYAPGLPALWTTLNKAAGPVRNGELLIDAIDLAIARKAPLTLIAMPGPYSTGTHDMIRRFEAAQKTIDAVTLELIIEGVSR